jgi:uncharacterized protein involved in exopolysaccharide biosynthesis
MSERAWIEQRIAAKQAQIAALDEAITALTTGGVQSYRLMTGQTDQMVTRANLATMRDTMSALENDVSTLNARLGCGRSYGQPGF